jgi:uncharacterized protein with HEPN domain
MTEKDKRVIKKMIRHCENIISYTKNVDSEEAFTNDSMVAEAAVFNLLQIGELSKQQLSDEIKVENSSIPWNAIYGLRNRVVHGYGDVDFTVVWDTINDDIPELKAELEALL